MGNKETRTRILAVDDNSEALFALDGILRAAGYEVLTATDGEQALRLLTDELPDLVLLDVRMPKLDGLEVARRAKRDPVLKFIPITLLTSLDSLEDILEGFDAGADDYIKKPFRKEELLARVRALIRLRETYQALETSERLNRELGLKLEERGSFSNIVGKSQGMRDIFTLIEKISDSDVPVLVLGETGTGKELIASAIHAHSRRQGKVFLAQNCSAFSESLLESELFGHVRGAFSGAVRDKAGLFEAADGGTFFLDELGEMSLALQSKLLRVLQDGTFFPLGSTKPKKVSVRVVAATHRDLEKMVSEGKFREDLFYRLNVVTIKLPALRERPEDVPLLTEHFLDLFSRKNNKARKALSRQTLDFFMSYTWPGNIRELQNEIERMILLTGQEPELGLELVSTRLRSAPAKSEKVPVSISQAASLKDAVEELERVMIKSTLDETKGNKSEAAKRLGISRSNLISKVQAYGFSTNDDD